MEVQMGTAEIIEQALRRDIDSGATVRPLEASLSAYLAGAYDLYEARLLGKRLVLAQPTESGEDSDKVTKRADVLGKALGEPVVLRLTALSRPQRRTLIEGGQAFMTDGGDYYLPQLALTLSEKALLPPVRERSFSPTQQSVFLYCLYAGEGPISQSDIQSALGLSSGSASSALSLFVRLDLLEFTTGGKTGRKKSYRLRDRSQFYRDGIRRFGSPVREAITAPLPAGGEGWLKSGLSALADQSDLLPPERPEFAVSPSQAKLISSSDDTTTALCSVKVLRYDPAPFASRGCVDPLTMLLTVDEDDERISIALRQALRSCEWYQG